MLTIPTWCYDKEGEATLHYLAFGEGPPDGLSLTPPPGTHPHERERAARNMPLLHLPSDSLPVSPVPEVPQMPVEEVWQAKRGPGRPRKDDKWPTPDAT